MLMMWRGLRMKVVVVDDVLMKTVEVNDCWMRVVVVIGCWMKRKEGEVVVEVVETIPDDLQNAIYSLTSAHDHTNRELDVVAIVEADLRSGVSFV